MLIDHSKPNGVPREKMWILPTALDDLKEFDNSVQMRLYSELRKNFFSLEHLATKTSQAHYRVRFGDYRATVYKDRDQYYIMRIFPKKYDQISYATSQFPSPEQLMAAERLPDPPTTIVSGTIAVNGSGTAISTPRDSLSTIPPLAQEALRVLQSVFADLYRSQSEMREDVSKSQTLATRSERMQRDLQVRLEGAVTSLTALKQAVEEFQVQSRQLMQRWEQTAANFDGAIEAASGELQSRDAKLAELQNGLQDRHGEIQQLYAQLQIQKESLTVLNGQLDGLATLSDWKRAYPDLPAWLNRLEQQHTQTHSESVATVTEIKAAGEQREREFTLRCQTLEAMSAPRTELESHRTASQEHIERLQSRIQQLEDRLARAEQRSFWQWLTGG
ncbi:MAG TPA: hypothetical protein VFG20_01555 [Planctomycetaceae bacterium]|nr:hypothetical protein [Planctomycetaceae bacterium]